MLLLLAMSASAANLSRLWPGKLPSVKQTSVREELTAKLRKKRKTLGLNGLDGLDGEKISKGVVVLAKDRTRAGVMLFELESGPYKGVHACEALGRGKTEDKPHPGWLEGELEGKKVWYAPITSENGATLPGIYELRNIRPDTYALEFLNKDLSGEDALVARLTGGSAKSKKYFSAIWKTWYPRDPKYADVAPVDLVWSERYQAQGQGAAFPVYESTTDAKDPLQLRYNPRYYFGPYGRSGFAIHTDRWSDPQTQADPKLKDKPEARGFLYRDTAGCVKVRPDCLQLVNAFIDEQSAKGRRVLLEIVERK